MLDISSGSRNFGGGGPRNMKYKPPPHGGHLFLAYFLQAGGGHGPLGPPPGSATGYDVDNAEDLPSTPTCFRVCIFPIQKSFIIIYVITQCIFSTYFICVFFII